LGELRADTEREDLWRVSVAAYNARQQREVGAAWYAWHMDQAERHRRNLEALIAHHEGEAEKLLENGNGHHHEGDEED